MAEKINLKLPQLTKAKKGKYKYDNELGKTIREVESMKDVEGEYVIERIAEKGTNYITQKTHYDVNEIEVDWNSIVYKYIYEGKEYFSNFKFANPVETIYPKLNNDDTATA